MFMYCLFEAFVVDSLLLCIRYQWFRWLEFTQAIVY